MKKIFDDNGIKHIELEVISEKLAHLPLTEMSTRAFDTTMAAMAIF